MYQECIYRRLKVHRLLRRCIMMNKVETTFFKTVTLTLYGLVGYLLLPTITFAHVGYEIDLRGWAWSETVGWISFSCENTDTCNTAEYGVTITENGNLTGLCVE